MQEPESHGLPVHLARHIPENVNKVLAQARINKFLTLIKTIGDPQILGAAVSVGVGLVCTNIAEQENLRQSPDDVNYWLKLLEFYLAPTDTPETSTTQVTLGRLGAFISRWAAIGLITYEGVQKLQLNSKHKEAVKNGVALCPYQGHMVGIGFRDPFIFAENAHQESFVKQARQTFGNIVPVQSEAGFHNPADLGTPFNNKGYYANLAALQDGTPQAEMIEHILVSGAHQAEALVVNAQKDHELFEAIAVDQHGAPTDRPDFAASASFIKNTVALRKAVTKHSTDPNTVLVVPMHLQQKAADHSSVTNLQPWARSSLANFGHQDELMPTIKGIIVPEMIFAKQLKEALEQRGLTNETIYIDTEGQADSQGKAERCAAYLAEILEIDPAKIITNSENAEHASVCIMLRDTNRHTDASSQVNKNRLGHKFIFYPATTRHDIVEHQNTANEQTRIPILYKQDIASEILRLSQNQDSDFSVASLKKSQQLPK